ncbi:hypothetical protein AGR7A_pAt20074 [Agrobacterium deltaense NCPPB 1641]|uniref:PIN domain-containing protein n=1 Tax=Agrobacterium deltaense NCPPB 1641 TaxID=1183425 RepID=A0A1S7U8Y7_9HYPH|nr:hypothetical protein AGR7A_pAt20074 [Agrobacterium deltaense NCPPB 1641]
MDITDAHLIALTALPFHHRDPFDHLLMAQAVAEEAHFVSQDQNVPALRHSVCDLLGSCRVVTSDGAGSVDEAVPVRPALLVCR